MLTKQEGRPTVGAFNGDSELLYARVEIIRDVRTPDGHIIFAAGHQPPPLLIRTSGRERDGSIDPSAYAEARIDQHVDHLWNRREKWMSNRYFRIVQTLTPPRK